MIINFDRTPDDFYRLSEEALERGETVKALDYAERALEGKRSARILIAEIFMKMERYKDAMDAALSCIAKGTEQKAEAFDVMARATTASGKLYDSFYYVMGKAEMEGDDETLGAMDEVVTDIMNSHAEKEDRPKLFLVGEKKNEDQARLMEKAAFLFSSGQYSQAKALARSIPEDSSWFNDAEEIVLRSEARMRDLSSARKTAKRIISRDPSHAFALFALVGLCGDKDFVKYLDSVRDEPSDLYFASSAANSAKEWDIAIRLSSRLIAKNPYSPEAYFLAAGVRLNAGKTEESLEVLRSLFSIYKKYPANLILKRWARLKSSDVMFDGTMPESIVKIMYSFVKDHSETAADFTAWFLSDGDFRASIRLLFEAGHDGAVDIVCRRFYETGSPVMIKFFEEMLISTFITPPVKRELILELLLKKHKGKLSFVPSAVITKVDCRKPKRYGEYPEALKAVYAEVMSFLICMFDIRSSKKLSLLTEAALDLNFGEKEEDTPTLSAAIAYIVLMEADEAPFGKDAFMASSAVKDFFGIKRPEVKKMEAFVPPLYDVIDPR